MDPKTIIIETYAHDPADEKAVEKAYASTGDSLGFVSGPTSANLPATVQTAIEEAGGFQAFLEAKIGPLPRISETELLQAAKAAGFIPKGSPADGVVVLEVGPGSSSVAAKKEAPIIEAFLAKKL